MGESIMSLESLTAISSFRVKETGKSSRMKVFVLRVKK
jgi:hypothetical protein